MYVSKPYDVLILNPALCQSYLKKIRRQNKKENHIWDPELPKLASGTDPNHFPGFPLKLNWVM